MDAFKARVLGNVEQIHNGILSLRKNFFQFKGEILESQASVMGNQKVLVASQQQSHRELSDKIDHMQVFFTSQMSKMFTYIKDVDAKKGEERPESSNASTKDTHPNRDPVNYF